MILEHRPFNEFDMAGVIELVNRYKAAGLDADQNVDNKERGVVRVAFENPVSRDGSIVIFDVHKLSRRKFAFRRVHWIVQLCSRDSSGVFKQHGCVAAPTQANALHKAEVDLKHGFLSVKDFSMASKAS